VARAEERPHPSRSVGINPGEIMSRVASTLVLATLLAPSASLSAQQRPGALAGEIERLVAQVSPEVVE
jgi:hypothetical protein